MALTIPVYLRRANIQDKSLRYEWDDWRSLPASETPDDEIVDRLDGVSQRAVLAFMCGTAEWIVHRFRELYDDPAPWAYLEGAWAMLIDVRYCGYGPGVYWQAYAVKGWDGPIKKPIDRALERLEIAIQQLAWHDTDPVGRAGVLAARACYLMTDAAPYKRWCEQVLERFDAIYPWDPDDELGDVVPRQAIDPDSDFRVEQTDALINQFLTGLDYRSSEFLSSPERMLIPDDMGVTFRGTPYVFDIEADRLARRSRSGEAHG